MVQLNLTALFSTKKNNRRKSKSSSEGLEVEFNGQMYRDPQQIVTGWGQYFQNLYSDTEREHFDAQFKSQVDH